VDLRFPVYHLETAFESDYHALGGAGLHSTKFRPISSAKPLPTGRAERAETGGLMATCEHLDQIKEVTPSANGCEDCLRIGEDWVHLRLCMSCGHVGCCDSSKNKHATKHFHKTHHPIIKSFEPGEEWGWCYVDELFFESL